MSMLKFYFEYCQYFKNQIIASKVENERTLRCIIF